ncbi:dUTP diphosphatase [Selenomonas ruminantium]|nr:deoxyuridine 5'-triphosphate nucleotidohydrolase [Selenomonas ruminantium]
MKIKVKEIRPGSLPERHGDWVDLKAGLTVKYNKGDFVMIPLGVAMRLPQGYEGHLLPRSSTFKKYGVLLVNGTGIIDNAYAGNGDEWHFPVFATRDGVIRKGERIAQFRAVPVMKSVKFSLVSDLDGPNRGGFGSTGR